MIRSRLTFAAATLSLLLVSAAAEAATIPGLFNTGTDANNVALVGGDGVIDPHYSILSSTSPGFAGQQAVTFSVPVYVPNDADSRWISIRADGNPGLNTTVYRMSFDLTGLDHATAQISGFWATDNNSFLILNGQPKFNLPAHGISFFQLHAFSITSGFIAGINHLDFSVTDVGPPTALRVDGLNGTADALPAGVPEPAAWALMITGFGLAGGALRRRMGYAPKIQLPVRSAIDTPTRTI